MSNANTKLRDLIATEKTVQSPFKASGPKIERVEPACEIHITSPTLGTWLVRWRRIGCGFETQHFDTWEPVADLVRRLLEPR